MKYLFAIFILVYLSFAPFHSLAQDNKPSVRTGKISHPEKCWAIGHLFIAKKTFRLTKEALQVADSIYRIGNLKGSMSGGQPDAFKHAYWMALLSQNISARKAGKLGKAHEKGNLLSYKKAKKKGLADSHNNLASEMDLWNNDRGIEIGSKNKNLPSIQLQQMVIDSIKSGAMRVIINGSLVRSDLHGPD